MRERQGLYRRSGEDLYLIGAELWLANIALVGQIYHLSSHASNALLLWAAGIAAMPWLLRSKALFVLSLGSAFLWLAVEANDPHSWFGTRWEETQTVLYALAGLAVLGAGYVLRRGSWSDFAGPAEKTGLLALAAGVYPLCWEHYGHPGIHWTPAGLALLAGLGGCGLGLLAVGLSSSALSLNRQWRWTWGLALAGLAGLAVAWLSLGRREFSGYMAEPRFFGWFFCVALFVFALLQVEAGIALQSRFMVNLAVTIIALDILACYIDLFGSMATTGYMFVISGVFLLLFGIYLERKRRRLMVRLRAAASPQP